MNQSEKIKIAIIDPVGIKAGMNYYDSSLMNSLAKKGLGTYIFSNYQGTAGEPTKYFSFFKNHINNFLLKKIVLMLKGILLSVLKCRKEKINFIIIHIFSSGYLNLFMILSIKIFGLKTIVISHDVSSFVENDLKFVQNIIYNRISDYIIVHNRFSLKELIKNIKIDDQNKINIIRHGAYSEFIDKNIKKNSARKMLRLDPGGKYLLFFGQIKKVKGLEILLSAMPSIRNNIKLIICGKPWKDDFFIYDQIIEEYKIQSRVIKFVRYIEDHERELIFKASDAIIIPYKRIYQSGVLLMGMSYGLPVIASDLEPIKEIIQDQNNGILFKTGNAGDLAEKVNLLFQNNKLRKTISEKSLETIRSDFSWEGIADNYIKMINWNQGET